MDCQTNCQNDVVGPIRRPRGGEWEPLKILYSRTGLHRKHNPKHDSHAEATKTSTKQRKRPLAGMHQTIPRSYGEDSSRRDVEPAKNAHQGSTAISIEAMRLTPNQTVREEQTKIGTPEGFLAA